MSTIGQQVLDRITAVETTLADIQNNPTMQRPPTNPAIMVELEQLRNELRQEINRAQEAVGLSRNPFDANGDKRKSLMPPKDCLPPVLGNDYQA